MKIGEDRPQRVKEYDMNLDIVRLDSKKQGYESAKMEEKQLHMISEFSGNNLRMSEVEPGHVYIVPAYDGNSFPRVYTANK